MPYSVGILIIGSLYWDNSFRQDWRQRRLSKDKEDEYPVKVPIRYGRLSTSEKRRDTYTMVFSLACRTPDKLGQGIAVRCLYPVAEFPDLVSEAEELWAAERGAPRDGTISRSWGCVGLLANPASGIPQSWLDNWAKRVAGKPAYGKLAHAAEDGKPPVTDRGLLDFGWPARTNGDALPLDLLLATANEPLPRPVRYPDAATIANAWNNHPPKEEYFWCDRAHGIFTFQDEEITKYMKSSPAAFDCMKYRRYSAGTV